MAGFGSLSLAQTVIGSLIDQRAVVLYKQPNIDLGLNWLERNILGGGFTYEELFSGLLGGLGVVSSVANLTGTNPYGITYMDAKVNIESDLCDHPVEDGTLLTDACIILPVSAEVNVAMPTFFAERIYNQMRDLFEKKESKIILQTKYGIYKNLVIQNMSYELEKGTVDRTVFSLTLREIQDAPVYGDFGQIVAQAGNVAVGSDANTVNTGTQMAVGV